MLLPKHMTPDELIHAGLLEPDNSLVYALAILADSLMTELQTQDIEIDRLATEVDVLEIENAVRDVS